MSRITDPAFKWISSASHDADSRPFYERQMKRIADAKRAREEEAKAKVQPITKKRTA